MRIATLIGAASLLLSTAAWAQDVSYDYDKARDFTSFKTYAWVRGTNLSDELNHQRVVDAIDAQLAAKGLRKVERGGNPDVLVAYHAAFGRDLQVNGSGWGGYRVNRAGSARVEEVVVGALGVEIADAKTGAVVWHGVAKKDIDVKASPEKREKNINKAVEKLLKSYPASK